MLTVASNMPHERGSVIGSAQSTSTSALVASAAPMASRNAKSFLQHHASRSVECAQKA